MLKDDKRRFFTAASHAQKAADFLRARGATRRLESERAAVEAGTANQQPVAAALAILYPIYTFLMLIPYNPIVWIASAKKDLQAMPEEVQRRFNAGPFRAQCGKVPGAL